MLRFKLSIAILPLFFMGCASLYVPDSRNTLVFEEAGEFHTDVSYGLSGVEIKSAISITKFIGIGYSGSFLNRTNTLMYFQPHSHRYNEFMGLFHIGEVEKVGRLSFTAGYGAGTSTVNKDEEYSSGIAPKQSGDFERFYVQPTLSYKQENTIYGLANRFSYVTFSSFSSSESHKGNSFDGYYFEPAFFIRRTGKVFSFITQIGTCIGLDDTAENVFKHENYNFSAGLSINLGEVFSRIDSE